MEYKQQYSEMLTKLPFLKGVLLHSQRFCSQKVIPNKIASHTGRKQLSLQHINNAQSIDDLFKEIPSNKIIQNSYFKYFMRKITSIMIQLEKNSNSGRVPLRALLTKQEITYLQKYYLEIRSVTSAELHSGASDLIMYQLFFKKLKQLFGQSHRVSGFEVRATMVAQSLTKITTYDGWQPISLSLLHYMSTISLSSKDQLKKNLSIYFLQYFISYQLKKSHIETLKKNHNENKEIADSQVINKLQASNFVDVCSILLGCSTSRPNKNVIENKLDSLATHNLNRFLDEVCNQLHIKEVINEYSDALKNQNKQQVISKIIQSMMKNPYLRQINNPKCEKIVVNNKLRFLQIVDMYMNAIDKDYLSLLIFNQTTYNFNEQITKYLYLIFSVSENMSVVVSNVEDKIQRSLNLHKMNINNDKQIEQINLWKISSKIIQVLAKNTIKINSKQNLKSIILDKVITYIKTNIHDKQQFEKNKESIMRTIQSNIPAIINLIAYMPVQTLQNYFHKYPLINQHLHELLKLCFENLKDYNIENIKLLEKDIIKMLKFKKTLIMTKQQLAEWLQIFINRAEKLSDKVVCWKLYYFLASTEDKTLQKLINLDVISQKIIRWRNQLEQKDSYSSFESIMNLKLAEKNKRTIYTKNKEIQQLLQRCWINRKWELEFLKLHGLIILLNKQAQLQDLVGKENEKSSKYKITLSQMQQLFESWIKPFEQKYCIFFEVNFLQMKSNIQFLDEYLVGYKHMAYFRNYFIALFEQTQMLFQYKLINKILMNPITENYLLYNQKHLKENHLFYYLTLVMGMGDPIHKNSYFTKYELSKVLPRSIFDDKTNADSKQDDESSGSQTSINISVVFNSTIDFISLGLYTAEQWKYFSSFFMFYNSFHQSKDIHVLRFKIQSELSKAAYVQALVENEQKQKKFIDKTKLQYQSAEAKRKIKNKLIYPKYCFPEEISNIRQLYRMKMMDLSQGYCYGNINLKPNKFNQKNYIEIQKIIINSFIQDLDPIKYHNAFQRRVIYTLSYLWQLCLPEITNHHFLNTMEPNSKIMGEISQKYLQKQAKHKLYNKLLQFIYRQQKCLPRILYFLKMFGILDKQLCKQVLKLKIKQLTTSLICISVIGIQEIIDEGYFTLAQCNSMKQDAYKISSMVRDSSFLMYITIISCDNKQKLQNLEWPLSNLYNQVDKILLKRELNIKLKNLNQINNQNNTFLTNKKEQVKNIKNKPQKKGFFVKKQINK